MSMKAVIFDLDDTLYPEISYCLSGYRAAAAFLAERNVGNAEDNFLLLKRLFEEDPKMVFNRFFESMAVSYEKRDIIELIDIYRGHRPEIEFYPDVMETVRNLRDAGMKLGILSDGFLKAQRQKIAALECEKYFDEIVLTDELGREAWKPSAAGINILKEKFAVNSDEILYVGDNPSKDFYLKITAGCKTARIRRENGVYNDTPYLEGVKEDHKLESLMDVLKIIK